MSAERALIDTWGWIALADRREPRHVAVRTLLSTLWRRGGLTLTTDYILDETFTLVFRRLSFARARRFLSVIDEGESDHTLQVERIGRERFAQAKDLRLRFGDKPLISFTDLTTMVVMKELRLSRIITADDHFRQVGLGFETVP